jgi:hypothetical protein
MFTIGLRAESYSGDALPAPESGKVNEQVLSSSPGGSGVGDWTWMRGSNMVAPGCPSGEWVCGLTGEYGTLGEFAAGNFPEAAMMPQAGRTRTAIFGSLAEVE